MRIRARKAFTLVELIAVIVIIGILGLIGTATYKSVTSKSSDEAVVQTAKALDKNVVAIAAFNQSAPDADAAAVTSAISELKGGHAVATADSSAIAVDAAGKCVVLTLGDEMGEPGALSAPVTGTAQADGSCA